MSFLSEESLRKPALALIDTSGSSSDDMIEAQLMFALGFAGKAGGLVGFFDTQMRSELMPLTAETVGRLIAAGDFPGRGGTDIFTVKEAMDSLPQGRGPMRVAVLSDWGFGMPETREDFGLSESDEMFMMGDCLQPGVSQTDGILDSHQKNGSVPEWIHAWSAQQTWAFASEREAIEIGSVTAPRAKSSRPAQSL